MVSLLDFDVNKTTVQPKAVIRYTRAIMDAWLFGFSTVVEKNCSIFLEKLTLAVDRFFCWSYDETCHREVALEKYFFGSN